MHGADTARRGSTVENYTRLSKVYAWLLVTVALIAMAAIGTVSLVMVMDVGYVAYRLLKPGAKY